MNQVEHIDERGRKYQALREGEQLLLLGPPEDLVDDLGLPEPFATRLHNILYTRGIFSYKEAAKDMKNVLGALQEAYQLDVQKLLETLYNYTQEVRHE